MSNALPKVTLLGSRDQDYLVTHSGKKYIFSGGVGQRVPVPVAMTLVKKQDRIGRPIFRVEDMPEIVRGKSPRVPVNVKPSSPRQTDPVGVPQSSFLDEED